MPAIQKLVILGSGNVGTHLGMAFNQAGLDVLQVFSRKKENAEVLAGRLGCGFTDRMDKLDPMADMYCIALSDDAIVETAEKFPYKNKLLVHTSGTTPMDVLKKGSSKTGVFYPLQTFSKKVSVNYEKVPLLLEVSRGEDKEDLEHLAARISETVRWTDSGKREMLHLAAVFACNFVNHMYAVAADILNKQGMSFDLLHPLIEETARKARVNPPDAIQTGPARRNNMKVIEKHLQRLRENPDYHKLYDFISNNIRKTYGFKP